MGVVTRNFDRTEMHPFSTEMYPLFYLRQHGNESLSLFYDVSGFLLKVDTER